MSDTIILRDVWNSAAGMYEAHCNFLDIEDRLFFLRPMSDTIVGPPTDEPERGGDWAVDEMWVDSLNSVYICRVSGTPGTWSQIIAAVTSSNPAGAPTGYEIIRDDQERRRFRYNGSTWDRINRKVFEVGSAAATWGPFTHDFGYVPRVTLYVGTKEVHGGLTVNSVTAQADFDSNLAGVMIVE